MSKLHSLSGKTKRRTEFDKKLDESVLFEGQVGFVYGREVPIPTEDDGDFMLWCDKNGYPICGVSDGVMDNFIGMYLSELMYEARQQMQKVATMFEVKVSKCSQLDRTMFPIKVHATFAVDKYKGAHWFVGLELTDNNYGGFVNYFSEPDMVILENALMELAKQYDLAQFYNNEWVYEPSDWVTPTQVALIRRYGVEI